MMNAHVAYPAEAAAGARNLLSNCAGVKPGDTVLLLVEPPGLGYYDDAMGEFIAAEAAKLGGVPVMMEWAPSLDPDNPPAEVMAAIEAADHSIFLNRVGDQLRFIPLPGKGSKTMSYALDFDFLSAPFSTTPYGLFATVAKRLAERLSQVNSWRIQCPLGTDLSMQLNRQPVIPGDFAVNTFPMMILPPLTSSGANGKLVLSQALTSTYIHPYEDSIIPLGSPLTLTIRDGQIVDFDGDAAATARIRAQFERVAALFGGSVFAINSWHAGVNPTTFFPHPALSDMDRWAGVVFGSPRYVHFHMCGTAPGDICGQCFDPTITFDGEALWDHGRLAFLDRPEIRALLPAFGADASVFDARRDIGIQAEAAAA